MSSPLSRSLALLSLLMLASAGAPPLGAAAAQPGVVFEFPGADPVPPPATLDPRYTAEGLREAFMKLCQRLGYRVVRVRIDQSEFPFLIAAEIQGRCDYREIRDEAPALPGYGYGGSVTRFSGGSTQVALNLTPRDAYPRDQARTVHERLGARLRQLVGGAPRN